MESASTKKVSYQEAVYYGKVPSSTAPSKTKLAGISNVRCSLCDENGCEKKIYTEIKIK